LKKLSGPPAESAVDGRMAAVNTSRRPHVGLAEHALHRLERAHLARERLGEGLELLPQRHRHRVLELGAAHLEDARELLALGAERRDQLAVPERHPDVQGAP
jgi:hypothetical protein